MSQFDLSQIHSTEDAATAFQTALDFSFFLMYRCTMMGDYKNHKEAEYIIQTISTTPYAEEVFRTCLQYSDLSYCVFYVELCLIVHD